MLPIQLMVQNLLYETTQLTLPFDRVDHDYLRRPRRWQSRGLTSFAVMFGLLSSIFDLATSRVVVGSRRQHRRRTYCVPDGLVRGGSAVPSACCARAALSARPSRGGCPSLPLLGAVIAVVLVGLCLPFLPIAGWIGLTPLPGAYFGWLALILATYLAAAQYLKTRWVRSADAFP